ncbi:MAG: TIGR02597 family protein [Verrucomicrobia bacterium]|nr:TIGR02597 family protein [Verrucomicrobiota bacterium]
MSSYPYLKRIISLLLLAATTGVHAQNVSTAPVGYQSLTINGSPDGSTASYTALSVGFQNASEYSGSVTTTPNSAVLTDSSASLVASAYSGQDATGISAYYLEITSGTSAGLILDIVANTSNTITTGSDLTGLVTSGDTFAIKAHTTLAGIFGTSNATGLQSGGSASSSDLVYIMSTDGNGTYSTYYYQTDTFNILGGTGWRSFSDSNTDMSNVAIAPDDGIIVKRTATGDLTLVVSGNVKEVTHKRDLPAGFSLVAYPFPVDVTLADSNIYTGSNGYVSAGSGSSSDLVYILSSDGSFATYYRQTDTFNILGGDGWRSFDDSSTSRDSQVIPAGSSIIILHRGSGLSWSDALPYTL